VFEKKYFSVFIFTQAVFLPCIKVSDWFKSFDNFCVHGSNGTSSARRCQVVVVVAEVSVAAGRLSKSYLEVHFRIEDAKAVYSPGKPLSSFSKRGSEDGWPPGRHHNNLLIHGWPHESRWSLRSSRSDRSWYQHLNNLLITGTW
jgi:hypothetical protein